MHRPSHNFRHSKPSVNLRGCLAKTAGALSIFLFVQGSVLAYSPETNFWKERQKALKPTEQKRKFEPDLIPSWLHDAITPYATLHQVAKPSLLSHSKKPKIILLVQDAHLLFEAQTNIAELVGALGHALQNRSSSLLVGLEGADINEINFKPYNQIPERAILKRVADELLKQNILNGVETAAIGFRDGSKEGPLDLFPLKVTGIENQAEYDADVRAIRASVPLREKNHRALTEIKQRLVSLKKKYDNPEFQKLDQKLTGYEEGAVSLPDYVFYLDSIARVTTPQLRRMIEVALIEGEIDFSKVESERAQLMEKLVVLLNENDVRELLRMSTDFKSGSISSREYGGYLKEVCARHNLDLSKFPEINLYVQYVIKTETIDTVLLMSELRVQEEKVFHKISKTEEEKTLLNATKDFYLAKKLSEFTLTDQEWKTYQSNKSLLPAIAGTTRPGLTAQEDFYRIATLRNKTMATKMAERLAAASTEVGVLVAGGFHTDGLLTELKKKDFIILTLSPKITHVGAGPSSIEILASGRLPLDRVLAGERLFIPLQPNTVIHPEQTRLLIESRVHAELEGAQKEKIEQGPPAPNIAFGDDDFGPDDFKKTTQNTLGLAQETKMSAVIRGELKQELGEILKNEMSQATSGDTEMMNLINGLNRKGLSPEAAVSNLLDQTKILFVPTPHGIFSNDGKYAVGAFDEGVIYLPLPPKETKFKFDKRHYKVICSHEAVQLLYLRSGFDPHRQTVNGVAKQIHQALSQKLLKRHDAVDQKFFALAASLDPNRSLKRSLRNNPTDRIGRAWLRSTRKGMAIVPIDPHWLEAYQSKSTILQVAVGLGIFLIVAFLVLGLRRLIKISKQISRLTEYIDDLPLKYKQENEELLKDKVASLIYASLISTGERLQATQEFQGQSESVQKKVIQLLIDAVKRNPDNQIILNELHKSIDYLGPSARIAVPQVFEMLGEGLLHSDAVIRRTWTLLLKHVAKAKLVSAEDFMRTEKAKEILPSLAKSYPENGQSEIPKIEILHVIIALGPLADCPEIRAVLLYIKNNEGSENIRQLAFQAEQALTPPHAGPAISLNSGWSHPSFLSTLVLLALGFFFLGASTYHFHREPLFAIGTVILTLFVIVTSIRNRLKKNWEEKRMDWAGFAGDVTVELSCLYSKNSLARANYDKSSARAKDYITSMEFEKRAGAYKQIAEIGSIWKRDVDRARSYFAKKNLFISEMETVRLLSATTTLSYMLHHEFGVARALLDRWGLPMSEKFGNLLIDSHEFEVLPVTVEEMETRAVQLMSNLKRPGWESLVKQFTEDKPKSGGLAPDEYLNRQKAALELVLPVGPHLRKMFPRKKIKISYSGVEFDQASVTPRTVDQTRRLIQSAEKSNRLEALERLSRTASKNVSWVLREPFEPLLRAINRSVRDSRREIHGPVLVIMDQAGFDLDFEQMAERFNEARRAQGPNSTVDMGVLMTEKSFESLLERGVAGRSKSAQVIKLHWKHLLQLKFLDEKNKSLEKALRDGQSAIDITFALQSLLGEFPPEYVNQLRGLLVISPWDLLATKIAGLGQLIIKLVQSFPPLTINDRERLALVAVKDA